MKRLAKFVSTIRLKQIDIYYDKRISKVAHVGPKNLLLILVVILLPLTIIVPHINESFFGADFAYFLSDDARNASTFQMWQDDYLGSTSTDFARLHFNLFSRMCTFVVGTQHAPQLIVYSAFVLYLFSVYILLAAVRRYMSIPSSYHIATLSVILIAFLSPVSLGYISNYFTVGLVYYTGFFMAAIALLLQYGRTLNRLYLVGIVLALSLIGHPPTFAFATLSVFLFAIIMGLVRTKGLILLSILLVAINFYWLLPLAYSLTAPSAVSLSSDKGYIDQVFDWYNSSINIFQNVAYSIYPSSKLFKSFPPLHYAIVFFCSYALIVIAAINYSKRTSLNEGKLFIASLAVLLALLSISFGTNYAFGPLFDFIWHSIPALHFFKSFTQILNVAIVFFFIVLYMALLMMTKSGNKYVRVAPLIMVAIISSLLVHIPSFNSYITRGTIPDSYYKAQAIVDSDKDSGKVLTLPEIPYEFYKWNKGWDNYFASQMLFTSPTVSMDMMTPVTSKLLRQNPADLTNFVEENNFRYVLYHKDYETSRFRITEHQFNKSKFKIVLDTKEFTLYKLQDKYFKPVIYAGDQLINLQKFGGAKTEHSEVSNKKVKDYAPVKSFLNKVQGDESHFAFTNNNEPIKDATLLTQLYPSDKLRSTVTKDLVNLGGLKVSRSLDVYRDPNGGEIYSENDGSSITLFIEKDNSLLFNNRPVYSNDNNKTQIKRIPLTRDSSHYVMYGSRLLPITKEREYIGTASKVSKIELHNTNGNLLNNRSFASGRWSKSAQACGGDSRVNDASQSLNDNPAFTNEKILSLSSKKSIACTYTDSSLPSGAGRRMVLNFKYQNKANGRAGFVIEFDSTKNVVSEIISNDISQGFRSYSQIIEVPNGAKNVRVHVYNYPNGSGTSSTSEYTNIMLEPIKNSEELTIPSIDKIDYVTLPQLKQTDTFRIPGGNKKNRIIDGSFEAGAWQDEAHTCSRVQKNSKSAMQSVNTNNFDGNASLLLEAKNTIACTWTSLQVDALKNYHLSFAYKGLNNSHAGFNLKFDDDNSTQYEDIIKIKTNDKWLLYEKLIEAPYGSRTATLTLYSYSTELDYTNRVSYDDVRVEEGVGGSYYLLSKSKSNVTPKAEVEVNQPTKKIASVRQATGSFLLSYYQTFHDGWNVYLLPVESRNSDIKDKITLRQSNHIEINDYANGWFIDANNIRTLPKQYWQEAQGGGVNLRVALIFKPQDIVDKAIAISVFAIGACALYVIFYSFRKRRQHEKLSRLNLRR